MAGILFDSSVYIDSFRRGDPTLLSSRSIDSDKKQNLLWLSVVVLEELYAGMRDTKTRKFLSKLEKDFDRANRLLVPVKSDWTNAGHILNKIGEKHGFEQIGKGRLTNDTLIATTVARIGLMLLTTNAKDYIKISEFRELNWRLISPS